MVALKSEDAEADRAISSSAGLGAGPVFRFTRKATLPDGVGAGDRLRARLSPRCRRRPTRRFFACQHLAPDVALPAGLSGASERRDGHRGGRRRRREPGRFPALSGGRDRRREPQASDDRPRGRRRRPEHSRPDPAGVSRPLRPRAAGPAARPALRRIRGRRCRSRPRHRLCRPDRHAPRRHASSSRRRPASAPCSLSGQRTMAEPNSACAASAASRFGNDLPLALIAGPCQMESRDHAFDMAGALKEICGRLGIGLVYKTSFDKANRTSLTGRRGIGLDGGAAGLRRHPQGTRPAGADRRARAGAMRRGGGGRRRAADPGLPLPPDRSARRRGARPGASSTSRRASSWRPGT